MTWVNSKGRSTVRRTIHLSPMDAIGMEPRSLIQPAAVPARGVTDVER
jgi:hypothetical protein